MHRCPFCRYGFHDAESLEKHLDDGCPEDE